MLRRSTEILAGHIYKVPSEWMTGGPVDLIISGSSYADGIRGEKGGAEIEASMPVPSERRGPPRFARVPKFRIPRNPRTTNQSVRRGVSGDPSLGDRRSLKDHSTQKQNGSSRLKASCFLSTKRFFGPEQRTTRAQRLIGNDINSFFTRSLNPFGG